MSMTRLWRRLGVPLLIVLVGTGSAFFLAKQDRAKQVTGQGVPIQPPAPVLATPAPGQEQAYQGRNNVPGGTIHSLDKINGAAAAVGCDQLRPDDPAWKLITVAECLADRAVANLPGGQKEDVPSEDR